MDIKTKTEYVKHAITMIVTHDDAPIEEVAAVMRDLADFIAAASSQLVERRRTHMLDHPAETQTIVAADVGVIAGL